MMRKVLVFDGQWSLSHKVPHIFGNPAPGTIEWK